MSPFKIIPAILALSLSILLTSCGGSAQDDQDIETLAILYLAYQSTIHHHTTYYNVTGTLDDPDGNPIRLAILNAKEGTSSSSTIHKASRAASVIDSSTTDANGIWTLRLKLTTYTIEVTDPYGEILGSFVIELVKKGSELTAEISSVTGDIVPTVTGIEVSSSQEEAVLDGGTVSGNLELWDQGDVSTTTLDDASVNCDGTILDSLFEDQWHLKNELSDFGPGDPSGNDINVTPVWLVGNCGDDAEIAIVDDGMDMDHADLVDNISAGNSYDYLDGDNDPSSDSALHGTAVAGVAAAHPNSVGGRGAAPGANLRSYNLLQNFTSANLVDAMTRDKDDVWISNNSWGPTDGTGYYLGTSYLWADAVEDGLKNGRDGKGTIYTFVGGNGAHVVVSGLWYGVDNSNYNGYANFYGVIAVCAVDAMGNRSYYSENGSNLWVCAPSNSWVNFPAITTTDIEGTSGYNSSLSYIYEGAYGGNYDYSDNDYTRTFGGTSSATPLISGVVALMLQENPDLTWRDVKMILAKSAKITDPDADGPGNSLDADEWTTNGAGYPISHTYGFGLVDAQAAVNLAATWSNLDELYTYTTETVRVNSDIPDNDSTGVTAHFKIESSGISSIEYVDVYVTFDHIYHGDLEFILTSPDGTMSILSEAHYCFDGSGGVLACDTGKSTWRFGTARNLGESPDGEWTLTARDGFDDYTGSLRSWSLVIYGTK